MLGVKSKHKSQTVNTNKHVSEEGSEIQITNSSNRAIKEDEFQNNIVAKNAISPNLTGDPTKKGDFDTFSAKSETKIKKAKAISNLTEKNERGFIFANDDSNTKKIDHQNLDNNHYELQEDFMCIERDPYKIRKSFSDYENDLPTELKNDGFHSSYYRSSLSTSPRLNKSNYYMNNDQDFDLFKSAVFFKSYGYQNNISFESILYRIYFEGYCFEDIKEHIYYPLRKVRNVESFFELLFKVIKTYCIVNFKIREHIIGEIDEIIIKKERLIKSKDGRFEIRNEFSGYTKFSKNPSAFINIVNKIYELVESLTIISKDIDKIIEIYLELYNLDKKSIEFDCSDLHRNMFARYVYEAPLIKHFINEVSIQFSKSEVYQSKFSKTLYQLIQLNQPLGTQVNSNLNVSDEKNYNLSKDDSSPNEIKIQNQNQENIMNENSSKKKKKKKKNKSEKATPTKQPESNKENNNMIQASTKIRNESPPSKKDTEFEEFEKKLLLEQSNNKVKIKPNISEEWILSLKQRLQKQKKI